MRYLLDTDTCIMIIRQKPPRLLERLLAQDPGSVGVSAITVAELSYGVWKSRDPARNSQALERFLLPLIVAPFDEAAATAYGPIRTALESSGQIIGGMDLLIAAHARALKAVLVTNNVREFQRIPGLMIENWMEERV